MARTATAMEPNVSEALESGGFSFSLRLRQARKRARHTICVFGARLLPAVYPATKPPPQYHRPIHLLFPSADRTGSTSRHFRFGLADVRRATAFFARGVAWSFSI